jgi:hypothetical protein
MINKIKKGKAAEYIAIAKLLLSGDNIYSPITDDTRVDFIINEKVRVQVKSFNDKKQIAVRKTGSNSKSNIKTYSYTPEDVDFFAAVDTETFEVFMIPIEFVNKYTSCIHKKKLKEFKI